MEITLNHDIDSLNTRFAIPARLRFHSDHAGFPVADITTADATACVALHGGQVLGWQPTGQQPVIWVSKAAVYQPGKSVRGGVPICWPWFGAMAGQSAHGFVRNRPWQVRQASMTAADTVELRLGLQDDASTRALWDFAFDLELRVTVGATLTMELVTRNRGEQPFSISEAMHTYFHVGDIHQTAVQGLDGTDYLDKVSNIAPAHQTGAVRFDGETDRVYLNTTADCLIEDPAWQRVIRIAKAGSTSTVVWNPWSEKEKNFADMAAGEYKDMVCVETANAGGGSITVPPGGEHVLTAVIGVTASRG